MSISSAVLSTVVLVQVQVRMYWRRASIHDGQAPRDATVPKRFFFRDNFVIFRRGSKRIAFFESVIFLDVSTCNFSIFVMSRDHFSAPFRGLYPHILCQMPGYRLSRLAKGTPSESRLSISTIGHSVARQCVHCCKGDAASQWEMAILGVSELRNPWTDWLKIWPMWLCRWVDLVRQIL